MPRVFQPHPPSRIRPGRGPLEAARRPPRAQAHSSRLGLGSGLGLRSVTGPQGVSHVRRGGLAP
eukprot:scaffold36167_cov71-Phaeocystis_antarctica.AAC.1